MNFQRRRSRDEPEINLIPMIDVLLVILIFLMVTTSYAKYSELQINLPQAGGEAVAAQAKPINVAVDASEHYAINNRGILFRRNGVGSLLKNAAGDRADPTIVINADAKTPHQSVINVMEAARLAGMGASPLPRRTPPSKDVRPATPLVPHHPAAPDSFPAQPAVSPAGGIAPRVIPQRHPAHP
jgi:biopolymer transport protein ExbD